MAALVCTGLMLVSAAVGAQDQENIFKKEVELLEALGIYQPPGYSEESYQELVTRAEFVSAVMHMAYLDVIEGEVKGANFSDVDEDNFYYKDILAAKNTGLISGMSYDRFMPDDTIKTVHAIGIIKKVLGYESANDSTVMAKGLADGVDVVSEDMTVGNVIKLLYNALEIDKMCYVSDGEWQIVKDETILKVNLEVDTVRGIVTANQYTSLYSANGTGRGNVISIDSVDFDCGEYDLDGYLGCEIEVYYKDTYDSERPEIVYVDKIGCESVLFDADDIISYANNTYTVRIPDKSRNKTYKIEADAAIIYNEVAVKNLNYMKPLYGDVELIDNDSDGRYDVVKINSYAAYFVRNVNTRDYGVYLDGQELRFDEDTIVTVDGKESLFSAITPQSVILVRESVNTSGEKYTGIDVCTTTIEGLPEGVDEDTVIISGTEYKINTMLGVAPSVNDEGTFYLDSRGRITYFISKIIGSERYGILLRAVCGEFENFVTIFTEDSQKTQYTVAEKATLDGEKKTSEVLCTLLNSRYELIRYKVNSKNEVTMIDTVDDGGNLEKVEADGKLVYASRSEAFATTGNKGAPKFFVDGTTKVFIRGADSRDEEQLQATTISGLVNQSTYAVTGYDMGEGCVCNAILIDKKDNEQGSIYRYWLLSYISKITKTVNSDDEPIYVLKGIYVESGKATEIEYTIDPEKFPNADKIQSGDIMQITAEGGEVKVLRYVYAKNGTIPQGFLEGEVYLTKSMGRSAGSYDDTMCLVLGKSINCDGNVIELEYNLGTQKETGLFKISGGAYLEYEDSRYTICDERRIPPVCASNEWVLIQVRSGGTTDVVFMKE